MIDATINYCLQCGSDEYKKINSKQFFCKSCGFTYFQNVAASAGAIIECRNQILACVRKYDPCKGMLGLPGGFVDTNESAESALKREILEELKIPISEMSYIGSFPNVYLYKCVEYHSLDLFFAIKLKEIPEITIGDEVAEAKWIDRGKINYNQFAFESIKKGLKMYFELSNHNAT
jgi:NAD+ diphosphatase